MWFPFPFAPLRPSLSTFQACFVLPQVRGRQGTRTNLIDLEGAKRFLSPFTHHSCLVEQLKLSCHAAGAQQAGDEDDFLDLEGEVEGEEAARPPLRAVAAGSQFPHLPGPASFLVSPLCMACVPYIYPMRSTEHACRLKP